MSLAGGRIENRDIKDGKPGIRGDPTLEVLQGPLQEHVIGVQEDDVVRSDALEAEVPSRALAEPLLGTNHFAALELRNWRRGAVVDHDDRGLGSVPADALHRLAQELDVVVPDRDHDGDGDGPAHDSGPYSEIFRLGAREAGLGGSGLTPWRPHSRRSWGRLRPQLPEHYQEAERERDDVRAVAEGGPRVAGRERVGGQQGQADVDQRPRPLHDLAAGTPELANEKPEAGPGEERAEQAELLADVAELPWIGTGHHVHDALRQVDDDRLARREVNFLELEVRPARRVCRL